MSKRNPSQQSKKNEFSLVHSSAAEYLTFIASSGQGGIEAVYANGDPTMARLCAVTMQKSGATACDWRLDRLTSIVVPFVILHNTHPSPPDD